MFTWGSKYFFAVSAFAYIGAMIYGLTTGGDPVGVFSFGYKGGVGDHFGYTLLLTVWLATGLIASVAFATRDGDAQTMAARAGAETVPQVTPPTAPSYWGVLMGFGFGCLILGASVSVGFLWLGIAVMFVVGIEWMTLAWSDRATGDPEVNSILRQRFLGPIEIPMLGMLAIAVVVLGTSRVLLTVSEIGAVVFGAVAAFLIFGAAVVMAKTDAPRKVISSVVALGAVAVLAGGVFGAINGERDFHHGEEHGEEPHNDGETEGEG